MAWWTSRNVQIKQKNNFIVSIGNMVIPTIVSCDKPKVTIEKKEYTMINQVYQYPGIAKWQPITMKFVDGSANSFDESFVFSQVDSDPTAGRTKTRTPIKDIDDLDAAQLLWKMLTGSGYKLPRRNGARDSSTAKTFMMDKSFRQSIKIQQLEPDGVHISEGWTLYNPIITEISWGSLDYTSNDSVEYSVTIAYDYAELTIGEERAVDGSYKLRGSSLRKRTAEEIENETIQTLREGQERLDRLSNNNPLTPNADGAFDL